MSKKKTDSEVNYSKRNCKLTVVAIILYSLTVMLSAGILAVSVRSCKVSESSSDDVSAVDDFVEYDSSTSSDDELDYRNFYYSLVD